MSDFQQHNDAVQTEAAQEMLPLQFLVGSWFLHDSYQYCTQTAKKAARLEAQGVEWVHYATGLAVGNLRTIERIVTFSLENQSPVYVSGIHASTRDVLIQMSEYGYALHAVCHSHPGNGINATHPSTIDISHQKRLERGGYHVISCIYSRDGFARFFTVDSEFAIEIYGKGVEEVDRNVFHLAKGH